MTIARSAVRPTIALATITVLAACQGALVGGDRSATIPTLAADVGAGAGGPGSITLSLTQPTAVEGHVTTPVACTTGRVYQASASSAPVQDSVISFSVRATGYSGAGDYATVVSVTLVEPDGTSISVPAVPAVPAQITDTGGSFSMSATGSNGRTVALSLTWACSA